MSAPAALVSRCRAAASFRRGSCLTTAVSKKPVTSSGRKAAASAWRSELLKLRHFAPRNDEKEFATPLFLQQRLALLLQPFQLFSLLRNPVGAARFVLTARIRRSLFDQLLDILARGRDALIEFLE